MENIDKTPLIEDISGLGFVNTYIPGGILKAKYDQFFTIVEANSGYFDLVGYSKEEIRDLFLNRGSATLHPEDAAPAAEDLLRQISNSPCQKFNLNCRLVNKIDGYKHVQFSGRLATEHSGEQFFYFQLIDITTHVNTSIKLEKEREFNMLIASFTENEFFDYNLKTKTMRYSENLANRLGIPSLIEDYPKPLIDMGIVTETDMDSHQKKFNQSNKDIFETETKFVLTNGDVLWYLCHYKILYTAGNKPERIVGKMMEITLQKTQINELTHKAITDQLTGVYNKMTTQALIEETLKASIATDTIGSLFIIDLDNFKKINDTFGHSYGDKVLSEVASKILHSFRQDDIVGRLGGDEFFVYMKGYNNDNGIHSKADEICKFLANTYTYNGLSVSISASIGIAHFPEHGKDFAQLYENADIALYTVKFSGKNNYKIFSGETRPV